NLNFGPEKGTQSILNIQPVIPITLNKDWNIITRTILPVVWQPALSPDDSSVSGISDLQFTAFLSPANPDAWIWGVGAITHAPKCNSCFRNERLKRLDMPMNRMMIASVLRAASLLSAYTSTPTQAVSSAATNYLDAYSTWAYAKQAFDQ